MNKKDPRKLTPSEMVHYIDTLHSEIDALNKSQKDLLVPDTWATDSNANGNVSFNGKQDILDRMEVGDILELTSYKTIRKGFHVKINEHRFDEYDTRIKAEGMAMLHRKD